MTGDESAAGRLARGWVAGVCRRPRAVLAAVGLATLALGAYAATHLGVNTDTRATMLSQDLPSEQRARHFEALFPGLSNALLVVVDAPDAGAAADAARRLSDALRESPHVVRAYAPGTDPFFERHALLYRTPEELAAFGDHLAGLQPVMGELSRSPTLPTLTRLIERGLREVEAAAPEPSALPAVLDRFGEAAVGVYAERPLRVSWEGVLLAGTAIGDERRTLVVEPVLHTDAVLPASAALAAIRDAARGLGLGPGSGVRVRITGYPALNDEEMRGLLWDVGVAGLFSFAMVLAILGVALRSLRAVAASAVTLVVGLVWSAAFAAAAVGRLNLVSLTFAVLFIGLGVDFAIHLGMHFLEARQRGARVPEALVRSAGELGPALGLCTVSTAIGFLSFSLTDYRGVAELGLIAAAGMVIILALTFTLLPALLCAARHPAPPPARETHVAFEPERANRHPARVAALAGATAAVAALLAPGVRFDSNVVSMRNPDTESVRTWNDLLESGTASPWYIDLLAPDLAQARAIAARLEALPEVEHALTLASYVPDDQETKREILADLAFLLAPLPPGHGDVPEVSAAHQVEALRSLRRALERALQEMPPSPLARSARRLHERLTVLLERLGDEPDPRAALAELGSALFSDLPAQLERLHRALEPDPVSLRHLPAELAERLRAPDGTARVQVFPRDDLNDPGALARFVAAVVAVAPEATGLPVNVVEFGRATARSLRLALGVAFAAIAALLVVLWRRPLDAALALVPLALAAAWTVASLRVLGLPFNFANVIVLPLLLGIGVDSGIHLVSRARRPLDGPSLASTTTGRAVFFSAASTLLSFGSLAFSGHNGIASLGQVLVIGMVFTLVANLGVLPSLILLRDRARR